MVYLKITPQCALTSWNPHSVFYLLFFYHPETSILGKGLRQERGGMLSRKLEIQHVNPKADQFAGGSVFIWHLKAT